MMFGSNKYIKSLFKKCKIHNESSLGKMMPTTMMINDKEKVILILFTSREKNMLDIVLNIFKNYKETKKLKRKYKVIISSVEQGRQYITDKFKIVSS